MLQKNEPEGKDGALEAGLKQAAAFGNVSFDIFLLTTFATKEDIRNIYGRIDNIDKEVTVLKSDVAVLKNDVAVLKTDVAVMKTDVAILKSDVAVLKSDVAELKGDVNYIRNKVDGLEEKVNGFKNWVLTNMLTTVFGLLGVVCSMVIITKR